MDKQQYHLLSYDIILINFPQPPQTPKKRWNEISQMPMNHPHLHSLPQCLKLLHWSELRGPMNCQANGTTCRGTVLRGTLRKNQPASSSGFMACQRKIWENVFDVFSAMAFFWQWFLRNHLENFPSKLEKLLNWHMHTSKSQVFKSNLPTRNLCNKFPFSSKHETPPPQENHPFKKASNNPKCEPPLEDQVPPAYHLNGKWAWQFCAIK